MLLELKLLLWRAEAGRGVAAAAGETQAAVIW